MASVRQQTDPGGVAVPVIHDDDDDWVPRRHDKSQEAVAQRAHLAWSGVQRHDGLYLAITGSVDRLESTIDRFITVVKWIGGPAIGAFAVSLGHDIYNWISTFHH